MDSIQAGTEFAGSKWESYKPRKILFKMMALKVEVLKVGKCVEWPLGGVSCANRISSSIAFLIAPSCALLLSSPLL